MLILLSPAKSLDFETPPTVTTYTQPEFVERSTKLIAKLGKMSAAKIGALMDISPALAQLNADRYRAWTPRFTPDNAKQAVLAFNGDVYDGLDAMSLTARQLDFAQQHLRILSGLYGVLKPLDLMQPYRLEMGTRLPVGKTRDLYGYWGNTVTERLNEDIAAAGHQTVINLASEEYFKVVRPEILDAPVVTPVFEDWKNDRYKIISFFAKRARGLMARYAIVNRLQRPEALQRFAVDGYVFAADVSTPDRPVFRRKLAASSDT